MVSAESVPQPLGDKSRTFIEGAVWLWCLWLVVAPIGAAFDAPEDYWLFPLVLLGLLSVGLLLAASAVLPRVGKCPLRVGTTAQQQEKQLTKIRELAGVQGVIGAALLATFTVFDRGALELSMFISSVMWLAGAAIYFVAFWGMARLESSR